MVGEVWQEVRGKQERSALQSNNKRSPKGNEGFPRRVDNTEVMEEKFGPAVDAQITTSLTRGRARNDKRVGKGG